MSELPAKTKAFLSMCTDTSAAVEKCYKKEGYDAQDKDAKFPEACLDLSVNHLTCLMSKREVAMKSVELLAGKDAVEKNFPYYEENKQKTLEMIELYKSKRATPDGAFWQPAV